jgi:CRP/FNR family cyclic AMP-dependent transcriptional regulator
MCKRLRQADNKIGGLVLLDVPGRVARLLLELADENDGEHITKRITHHLIAQMIGSSRETVSRTMRNLVDQNLIEVSRAKIRLCDREALETAAGRDTMGPAQRFHYDGKHDRRRQEGSVRR